MANKKITELQLAWDINPTDLVIIEKMEEGTCAISASKFTGPTGPQGPIGPRGEVGPVGPKGADGSVQFEELTPGQVEQLRGPQGIKGEKGDTAYPSHLLQEVKRDLGGIKKGTILTGMKLEEILEKILCYVPPAPTFVGMLNYKPRNEITFEDLNSEPRVEKDIVIKPQTIYQNPHGLVSKIGIVLAIPKTFGVITGIVDGANVSIEGAYSWEDVVLDVPNVGPVEYSICFPDAMQMANSGTVVKWNIQ